LSSSLASQFFTYFKFDHQSIDFLSRNGLLNNLVSTWILESKLASVRLDQPVVEQLKSQFISTNNLSDPELIDTFLRRNCFEPQSLEVVATKQYRISQYIQQNYASLVSRKFLDSKDSLSKVVYSLIRLEDQALARELFLQIKDGDIDFGEASALHSTGPERLTYGMVGPVQINQIHPILASTLRNATSKIVLPPIKIDQNWVIVRPERFIDPVLDEATASKIASSLLQDDLQAETSQLIESLSFLLQQ
jgi:hypothetical protein